MSFESLLKIGNAYEAYILRRIRDEGRRAASYETQAGQLAHGDITFSSGQNMEIKFDRRYHQTGNLYVEVAEKHRADQLQWVDSGIRCQSDAEWFGMGDYRDFLLFRRSDLQAEQDSGLYRIIEIGSATSRGFLLRPNRIAAIAVSTHHWPGMDPLNMAA